MGKRAAGSRFGVVKRDVAYTDEGMRQVTRPNRMTDTVRTNLSTPAEMFTPNWDERMGTAQSVGRVRDRGALGQVRVPKGGKGSSRS